MKTINESNYHKNMGILIDVKDPISYKLNHHKDSININYDKLLLNHEILLDKKKKYFIICEKGNKSKQAVKILEYLGYDVTYVINNK